MDAIYTIFIFIVVSVLYLNVIQQYNTGADLEVYEMDYTDPQTLQDTCELMQPLIFRCDNQLSRPASILKIMERSKFAMQVKDTRDFYGQTATTPESFSLLSSVVVELLHDAQKQTTRYFSENNASFVDEAGIMRKIAYLEMDRILRPPYTCHTEYDVLTGSKGTELPMRFHTYSRKFVFVTSGRIRVKMTPWKYRDMLDPIYDYETLDFRSPYNVWAKDDHIDIEDCVRFIEFDVLSGNVFYIPKNWWYSITYCDVSTVLFEFNYASLINRIAYSMDSFRQMLYHSVKKATTSAATKSKRVYRNIPDFCDVVDEEDDDVQDNSVDEEYDDKKEAFDFQQRLHSVGDNSKSKSLQVDTIISEQSHSDEDTMIDE